MREARSRSRSPRSAIASDGSPWPRQIRSTFQIDEVLKVREVSPVGSSAWTSGKEALRTEVRRLNECGQSALLLATAHPGNTSRVRALLQANADVNECDNRGASPLSWAATLAGDVEMVRVLLEARADLSLSDEDGTTPLKGACLSGKRDVVRLLLSAGATPDSDGRAFGERAGSAPSLAEEGGDSDIVAAVLEAAAAQARAHCG